jgi:ferredoxin
VRGIAERRNVLEALETRSSGRAGTTEEPAGYPRGKSADGRFVGRRKVKPKLLAVVTEACTGCAGAPICEPYCPVDQCMVLAPDERSYPFQRIGVDALKCVGCKKCVSRGPGNTLLDGCPWNAIAMVPTREWEAVHGELPY